MAIVGLFNYQEMYSQNLPFVSINELVDGSKLLNSLYDSGVAILLFDGDDN